MRAAQAVAGSVTAAETTPSTRCRAHRGEPHIKEGHRRGRGFSLAAGCVEVALLQPVLKTSTGAMYTAVVRRTANGFIKTSKKQGGDLFLRDTRPANVATFFQSWPRHMTTFLCYGRSARAELKYPTNLEARALALAPRAPTAPCWCTRATPRRRSPD